MMARKATLINKDLIGIDPPHGSIRQKILALQRCRDYLRSREETLRKQLKRFREEARCTRRTASGKYWKRLKEATERYEKEVLQILEDVREEIREVCRSIGEQK